MSYGTVNREQDAAGLPRFELSFAQRRICLLERMEEGDSFVYNVPLSFWIDGPLDVAALERAIGTILRRHDVLRATFHIDTSLGIPFQVIHPWRPFHLDCLTLTELDEEAEVDSIRRIVKEHHQKPFNLELGPLVRALLVDSASGRHVLSIVLHHIVTDGWSGGVLIRELSALYQAYSSGAGSVALPDLPIQYVDYAHWQKRRMTTDAVQGQSSYWRERLRGPMPALELPTRGLRPAVYRSTGAEYLWRLDAGLSESVKAVSQNFGATFFMTLLAAFKVLLYRYSGQEDILVGTPIAGRNRKEVEGLIGVFVNTLVMRTDLSGDPTFRELVARVKDAALGAYANQDVPFEHLVEQLQPERDLSRNPFFQVLFVLQNSPIPSLKMGDVRLRPLLIESASSKFDITLALMEQPDGALSGWLEYNTSLFDESTVRRMAVHYENILRNVAQNPDRRLSEIKMLTGEEVQRLCFDLNDTNLPLPRRRLHDRFEDQARRGGDSVAVLHGLNHISYSELERRSNQLAEHLREMGVRPEVRVAVCTERTPEMIACLLAVLKAGGTYVPVDAAYPNERIVYLLNNSESHMLLTQRSLIDRIPAGERAVLCIDSAWQEIERRPGTGMAADFDPENLSHIIYTSGSTGRPKGVAIRHSSAALMVDWAIGEFGEARLAGVLASTSICFDLSVYEVFAPLSCGGCVVLVNDALALSELHFTERVTLINTVPSAMSVLLGKMPASVATVNLAGEALKRSLVDDLYDKTASDRVYNLYGPSEDTTYSTFALIPPGQTGAPSIGRPIANTAVYILDDYLNLAPPGATGCIYIAGDGLARGYFNLPEMTGEKFIPNPYSGSPGGRLYRTGDNGRLSPDGDIEFLGRSDNQVKLRGFRIELGEIESVLCSHPAVKNAVVMVREDLPGPKRLVGYLVCRSADFGTSSDAAAEPAPDEEWSSMTADLKSWLRERLPEYMIPPVLTRLDDLPTTPNGKIDRKGLPCPEYTQERAKEYLAPRTETEKLVVSIFSETLALGTISVNDDFFELGGHSLLVAQVASRVASELGVDLPIRAVFESPTPEQLASIIEALQKSPEHRVKPISKLEAPVGETLLEKLDDLSDQELEALIADIDRRKNRAPAQRGQ